MNSGNAGDVVLVLFLALVGIFLYFFPAYVAHRRDHHQFKSILVLDSFLGWTFIGWVVCLAMALSATPRRARAIDPYAPPATVVAIGWYPDPADPGQQRWWDGRVWTDQVQSRQSTQSTRRGR
jgi:hypothetical protein